MSCHKMVTCLAYKLRHIFTYQSFKNSKTTSYINTYLNQDDGEEIYFSFNDYDGFRLASNNIGCTSN